MQIFNSFIAIGILTGFGIIATSVNIFLFFVIITKTPKTMGRFIIFLGKLAFFDCLFMISLVWLFLPNILLPFPGATVEGIMKCCGRTGALVAEITTYVMAALSQTAITECCLYRYLVFYKTENCLKTFSGPVFLVHFPITTCIITAAVAISNSYLSLTYEELVLYAAATNKTEYVKTISPTTAFIGFNVEDSHIIGCGLLIVVFFIFLGSCNISFSVAVWIKVNESKRSFSKETYKLQKSLIYILLAQALIPAASMLIPISVYLLGYLSGYQDILKSTTMELIAILLVGGYPFFNSIFCLYSMRPYRVFCKQLWRRATCRTAVDPTVVLLSTASTSGSSPGNFR